MGCGCGGAKNKQTYEVVDPNGKVTEVDSRTAALALVRKVGGTWRQKKA
jgi:hypothetical protein